MQVEFYRQAVSSQRCQNRDALRVRVPGYVSTLSWSSGMDPEPEPVQKGRNITPPPAGHIGLHQLTLEAFWLD